MRLRRAKERKTEPQGDKTVRGEPLKPPMLTNAYFLSFLGFLHKNIIGHKFHGFAEESQIIRTEILHIRSG